MKKLLLVALILAGEFSSFAQNNAKIVLKPYGFIRNYICFDTRENYASGGDQFNQIPMDQNIDASGDDINEISSLKMLASTTRLGLNINGPEILGAKSSAKIEADYNVYSGTTMMMRFRRAFVKLDWENSNLECGQDWHPISGDLMPEVISLAVGSPFNPFSRTPQIRYNHQLGNNITLTGDLLYQYQYCSVGPDGNSYKNSAEFSENSMIPEMYAAIKYNNNNGFMISAAANFLSIKPYTVIEGYGKVSDHVNSLSPLVFMSYKKGLLSLRAKTMIASNTAHLLMYSGYGVTKENNDGSSEYSPLKSSSSWITAAYGKKIKGVMMIGYMKNLGANDDLIKTYTRKGINNIDKIYRISPSVSYNIENLTLGIEYERTTVAYGTMQSDGDVENTHNISNNRLCMLIKYMF